jgi:hypothetical protein
MRYIWFIAAAPLFAFLAGCDDPGDQPAGEMLMADEAAQLNEAAEMLDVSNAPASPSNTSAR